MTSTIVIGAGIAGLSAAWELQAAGVSVRVIEAAPVVGGRMGDRFENGIAYNSGARLIYPFSRDLHRIIEAVGIRSLLVPLKGLSALCDSPDGPYSIELMPSSKALLTPGLSLVERCRLILAAVALRARKRRVDPDWAVSALDWDHVTLAECIRKGIGDGVLKRMIEPVFRGTRSFDADAISALFYQSTMPHLVGEDTVFTLAGGMGQLCAALANRLPVETGVAVTAVEQHADQCAVTLADGRELFADYVVIATEGARIAPLLVKPSRQESEMLAAIRYNALGVAHFAVSGSLEPGIEFAMRDSPTRIATYQQLDAAPQQGRPNAQVYCQLTPEAIREVQAQCATDRLDEWVVDEVRARIPDFDRRRLSTVNQWIPHKIPIFYPGYGSVLRRFLDWQDTGTSRIRYCGDWVSQALLGGACASGVRVAGQITGQ
ncbi:FAD-dependent oxidoreductase [Pandoraea fibrosis]|uniref:FAD-dependent oxidoreductase n=1 Tax=Pandoraea fibrosis TaxID=1891094 RepID=A0ABX6HX25_9BURK|nr:FAD-dependent oxidoreductase [Pandoraea fibrosis]QHE91592.1 FAD-dependent oxidoreductase [Pandoraea fibrosis]QHF14850.1 FAD-dependent oxidoreductase [Pandoraea fibrosis]